MAKSKGRLLAELLASDGKVKESNDTANTNAKTEKFYCVPIENQRVVL